MRGFFVEEFMIKKGKLKYGWGIKDVDYLAHKYEKIEGKHRLIWICPYYRKWNSMIQRCFCPRSLEKLPTYKGCTICDEWKYLSNFIKWVDAQPNRDWQVCNLDKDFLFEGNKHYGPESVVFISGRLNTFIINRGNDRGSYMLGVAYTPDKSKRNPFQAKCSNPFTGKVEYLGYFPTELEAHLAWKAKKHDLARLYAKLQTDDRVIKRLYEMYALDTDWTDK